ncbi:MULTISPECIES: YibE/F family protein [Vibrio]|uniref:YibE/F family protein n=1 Tax=Vibrio TaxID=662 RepID=UPI0022CD584B|nr:YibE/F family protein [Vibrio sp. NFR]MDA0134143.1 YibE/F family protein [Vibrio sp. NFR]
MIKRIYNRWGFTLLITLISTLIFQFSSSWSEDFRPKSRQQQEFVEATVTRSISNHVAPDPLVPDVMTGKQVFIAKILEGESEGLEVEVTNPLSRQHNVYVSEGDTFIMMIRETTNGTVYWAYNHKRSDAIYLMLVLFCALLLSFGKKEGINSMVALYFTAALIVGVLVPSIFAGWNPMLVSILLMVVIIVVSFILVSGYNRKSLCAMGGTLLGVIAAGVMAQWFGEMAHLSGIYLDKGEDVIYLTSVKMGIRWLMFVTIVVAALGAVMDVAISIASAYAELQQTDPKLKPKQLVRASMNIGRDIMGTMTNTLILAFAGGSLTTIMMVWGLNMPASQFMNMPLVGLAVVNALAGSVGIVLTIPFTAFLAPYVFKHPQVDTQQEQEQKKLEQDEVQLF